MYKIKRKLFVRYYEEKKKYFIYVTTLYILVYIVTLQHRRKKIVYIRQYEENKFSVVLHILLFKTTSAFLDAHF
jgi:hypothetical protein